MRVVAGAERFSAEDHDMALQLWVDNSGHWFVDTELGGVQVGQAYQQSDGTWAVEVNDITFEAPNLETAISNFVKKYDRSLVHLSPMSDFGELNCGDFKIVDL
jgi:hypothetical protein